MNKKKNYNIKITQKNFIDILEEKLLALFRSNEIYYLNMSFIEFVRRTR